MMRSSFVVIVLGAAACGNVKPNTPDAKGSSSIDAPAGAVDAPSSADAPSTPDAPAGTTTFTMDGEWHCSVGVDCEDVYDFDIPASSQVTIAITKVTMASVARTGLFAGNATTGTNLWNSTATDVCAPNNAQDVDLDAGPVTIGAGHYRLTVGRDWGFSGDANGTYTVTFRSSAGLVAKGATADDQASQQAHCQ
jgi:hypothetical protein